MGLVDTGGVEGVEQGPKVDRAVEEIVEDDSDPGGIVQRRVMTIQASDPLRYQRRGDPTLLAIYKFHWKGDSQ